VDGSAARRSRSRWSVPSGEHVSTLHTAGRRSVGTERVFVDNGASFRAACLTFGYLTVCRSTSADRKAHRQLFHRDIQRIAARRVLERELVESLEDAKEKIEGCDGTTMRAGLTRLSTSRRRPNCIMEQIGDRKRAYKPPKTNSDFGPESPSASPSWPVAKGCP